jgi:hypothetical protein
MTQLRDASDPLAADEQHSQLEHSQLGSFVHLTTNDRKPP